MGRTTDLRRAVAAAFVPVAEAAGFTIDRRGMPAILAFRRSVGQRVQIIEIQWDTYGRPRFVLNYGTCPLDGLEIDGRLFRPENVAAGWLADSGRLQPRRGMGPGAWFRQDRGWLQRLAGRGALRPAQQVAEHLVTLFPEVLRSWEGDAQARTCAPAGWRKAGPPAGGADRTPHIPGATPFTLRQGMCAKVGSSWRETPSPPWPVSARSRSRPRAAAWRKPAAPWRASRTPPRPPRPPCATRHRTGPARPMAPSSRAGWPRATPMPPPPSAPKPRWRPSATPWPARGAPRRCSDLLRDRRAQAARRDDLRRTQARLEDALSRD